MNKVELYVNSRKLDIKDDIELTLSRTFSNNEEFSYEFEIEGTENNQNILGYLNKLFVKNKFKYEYIAELRVNDLTVFQGTLYIDSATTSSYSCNLIGNRFVEYSDILGDINLNEIKSDYKWISTNPSSNLQHSYMPQYVINHSIQEGIKSNGGSGVANDTDGLGWGMFYPFAYYGKELNYGFDAYGEYKDFQTDNNTVWNAYKKSSSPVKTEGDTKLGASTGGGADLVQPYRYFFPAFNVPSIFKSIFNSKGYKVDGNFFSSQYKNLYQTFQGGEDEYIERDNQRFILQINKNIKSYITKKDGSNPPDFISKLDKRYSSVFEWLPESYEDLEGVDAIKFCCTKVLNLPDRTDSVKTAVNYVGNQFYNPVESGSINDISSLKIRKSGWYKINLDSSITLKADTRNTSTKNTILNNDKDSFLNLCSTAAPDGDAKSNFTDDVVSFANNIVEFQLVKKDSEPTLFSDFSTPLRQLGIEQTVNGINSPFYPYYTTRASSLFPPKEKITDIYINTNLSGESRLLDLYYPRNKSTYFVNSDDLVCGFRVGNQGNYAKGNVYFPQNRSQLGEVLNLPTFDKYIAGVGTSGNIVFRQDMPNSLLDNDFRVYSINPNSPEVTVFNAGVGNVSDIRFETYNYDTAVNLVGNNVYAPKNTYDVLSKFKFNTDLTRTPAVKKPAQNLTELYFDASLDKIPYDNPFTSAASYNKQDSTYSIKSSNLVWLEKDTELEARLISPVINISRLLGEVGDYVVAFDFDIKNFSMEYIGTSKEDYTPTFTDPIGKQRYTYMNQYLPSVAASSWISDISDTLGLEISIDNLTKTASVNKKHSSGDYLGSNVLNIDKYVNFGSINTENYINFKSKNTPSKIIFTWNKSNTPIEIFLGGSDDEIEINSSYSYSNEKIIKTKVNPSSINYIEDYVPILCDDDTVLSSPISKTDGDYYFGGSENSSLYFWNNNSYKEIFSDYVGAGVNYREVGRLYWPTLTTKSSLGDIDLTKPSTFITSAYNVAPSSEYIELTAYLPLVIYNMINKSTLVKISDSYFRVEMVDNYNVSGDNSCTITLSPVK